jgi:hypothetical protein
MMHIKFIPWDEETEGIAVEHDGQRIWSETSRDAWGQYFRHYMPRGVPVVLQVDPDPVPGDPRDYPTGEDGGARLMRWLVDNGHDYRIRPQDEDTPDGETVTMTGAELFGLIYDAAERSYWNGVDDVRERHGLR